MQMVPVFAAVAGTAAVLITVAAHGAAITGVGLAMRRAFVPPGERTLIFGDLFASFWAGVSVTLILLQTWHLVFPIQWPVAAIVWGIGIAGLMASRRELWAWLRGRHSPVASGVAVLAMAWVANRATGPVMAYDAGLYHLSAIRWAREYPLVLGLGNLHGRLAFNNSSLLLAAMLEVGPWVGRSSHLVNPLLMLPMLMRVARSAVAVCTAGAERLVGARRTYHAFNLLLLTPMIAMALRREFSSPDTDTPAALAAMAAASILVDTFTRPPSSHSDDAFRLLAIVGAAASSVTIKLSMAVFSGSLVVILLVYAALDARARLNRPLLSVAGPAIGAGMFAAALLGVWMIRGVGLSGYVLYPSSASSAPCEWRVPVQLVDSERDKVHVWARQYYEPHPSQPLAGMRWFKEWAGSLRRRALYDVLAPLAITVLATAWLVGARLVGKLPARPAVLWILGVPCGFAIAFWFVEAPAPRFASQLFWIAAAVTAGAALASARLPARQFADVALVIAVAPALLLVRQHALRAWLETPTTASVAHAFLNPAGPDLGVFGDHPVIEVVPFVTAWGLSVNVPKAGDQCWDAPLPCTPYPRRQLRTRRPGDVASGFVLDGVPEQ
jgi:hypothetical protein